MVYVKKPPQIVFGSYFNVVFLLLLFSSIRIKSCINKEAQIDHRHWPFKGII